MSDLAGSGALDLSVLEHHVFPLEEINEALDEGLPARHGGFTNFISKPRTPDLASQRRVLRRKVPDPSLSCVCDSRRDDHRRQT